MPTSIDSSSDGPSSNAHPEGGRSLMHRLAVRTAGLGRPVAGTRLLPLYGVLRHVGRRSRSAYATPVVAVEYAGGFLIPLPFGEGTQWLKNIQAADRAGIRHAGREYVVENPEVVSLDAAGPDLTGWVRFASRRVGIKQFVRVHRVDDEN